MRSSKSWFLIASGMVLAIACSRGMDGSDEGSEVKIINGVQDSANEFPSVILLTVKRENRFFWTVSEYCTGVITDANTVLAAAHCVKNLAVQPPSTDPNTKIYSGIKANFNNTQIQATNGFAFPETINNQTIKEEQVGVDLAVIKFPPNSFASLAGKFAMIASEEKLKSVSPRTTKVYLVGYGATQLNTNTSQRVNNIRNYGENILGAKTDRGYYTVSGSVTDTSKALANKGDSGGPLFLGDKQTLIGIGSALQVAGNEVTNYFTDLSSVQSQNLLKFSSDPVNGRADFDRTPRFSPDGNNTEFTAMCSSSNKSNDKAAGQLSINSGTDLGRSAVTGSNAVVPSPRN